MKFLEDLGFFWGMWPDFTGWPTSPSYPPANYFAADAQTPTPDDGFGLAEADYSGLAIGLRAVEHYGDTKVDQSGYTYSRQVTASLTGGMQLPSQLGPRDQVYFGTDVILRGTIAGVDGDSASSGQVTLTCAITATVSDKYGTPVGTGDGLNKIDWPVTPGTNVAVDQLLGVNATVPSQEHVSGVAGGLLLYTLTAKLKVEVIKQFKTPESDLWVIADFSPQTSVSSGSGGLFAEPQVLLATL